MVKTKINRRSNPEGCKNADWHLISMVINILFSHANVAHSLQGPGFGESCLPELTVFQYLLLVKNPVRYPPPHLERK